MNLSENNTFEQDDQAINIKQEVSKYLNYLPLIILSVLFALVVAFLYLRYTDKKYNTTSVVKILDNSKSGFKMPTDAISLFANTRVNLDNEIEMIRSYDLLSKAVDQLDLQHLYLTHGNIKETDAGSDVPFKIKWSGTKEEIDNLQLEAEIDINAKGYYLNGTKDIKKYGVPYKFKNQTLSIIANDTLPLSKVNKYKFIKRKKSSVVAMLKANLTISPVAKQSELLSISYTGTNANQTAKIVNTIVQLFNEDGIEDRKQIHAKTIEFVNNRFEYLFNELDSIEQYKAKYKKEQKLSSFIGDAGALLATKSTAEMELNKAITQQELSKILLTTIQANSGNELLPSNIGLEQVDLEGLVSQYNELLLQKKRLIQGAGPKHKDVLTVENTIAELALSIKKSLETYKKVLSTQIVSLEKVLRNEDEKYAALPYQEKVIRSIERQQEIKEALYIILLQKREEAAVNIAILSPSVKIVDKAQINENPVSPKPTIIYLGAFLVGLLLPVGSLYVYFLLDTKIHNKYDINKILKDVPVIAELPHIADGDDKMIEDNDRSVLSESFRVLRTNTDYLLNEVKGTPVVFTTSTIKGEGKTFVSMNLAITLSSLGKKIILVGADLRNPQLHKMLNISKHKMGLSNFLFDRSLTSDAIKENGKDFNLDFIFSGSIPPNPAELISNGRFAELINELKQNYDYVIVDTAPMLLVTDTSLITKYADLVVYVTREGYTDINLLNFIKDLKTQNKLNNLGIVLNDISDKKGLGYSYSYKYNYGYGYGYGAEEKKKGFFASLLKK